MRKLTPKEEDVILYKATEPPFSGKFCHHTEKGTYICRRCGAPLYRSKHKFNAGCGWPSFDRAIPGAVLCVPDADGVRTEIICARCGGHLGHVFEGEGFTPTDTRHCVNSVSLDFVPLPENDSSHRRPFSPAPVVFPPPKPYSGETQYAVFAGGCFWGIEYLMNQAPGVLDVQSGYTGGETEHPTYEQVCRGETGHYEAVRILFDPSRTDYETLAKLFFEIHDPTQTDGQGPDIGPQYRSAVFYANPLQKETARNLIGILQTKGLNVSTRLLPLSKFWPAETHHQHYYERHGSRPYCHRRIKRFD